MPCHPARARELLKKGRAIKRWFKGIFAIKLVDRTGGATQRVVAGVDPGSKREGLTVKSEAHTLLNVQASTPDWVSDKLKTRREMRRTKRTRKTPYRACRPNRKQSKRAGFIPPSTLARWNWKLRVLDFLARLYPITDVIVEDVQAETHKGGKRWNRMFAPLQNGKNRFYVQIQKRGWLLELKQGWETKALRDELGLKKSKNKLAESFSAHCVDSWVLANSVVGGHTAPDNTRLLIMTPLNIIRRQLHKLQPAKGGVRQKWGGTRCAGFEKGSLVRHVTKGFFLIGGFTKDYLSLLSPQTGQRVIKAARVQDVTHLAFNRVAVRPAAQA